MESYSPILIETYWNVKDGTFTIPANPSSAY